MSDSLVIFTADDIDRLDAREAARKALSLSGGGVQKSAGVVCCVEGPTGWTVSICSGDADSFGAVLARWRIYRGGSAQRLKVG